MRRLTSQRASVATVPSWPFVGQQQLGSRLMTAWQQGTLPAAMLFAGPEHLGKSTAAQWLAQHDHCRHTTTRPCGRCVGCRQVTGHTHPDVIVVDPETTEAISVETIRQSLQRFHFKFPGGRRQWLLIFEAQRLTEGAANALLKFLEEPPLHATSILTSSRLAAIPSTVVSRLAVYHWHFVQANHLRQWATTPNSNPRQVDQTIARAAGRPGWVDFHGNPEPDAWVIEWLAAMERSTGLLSEVEIRQLTVPQAAALFQQWELAWREMMLQVAGAQQRLLWPHLASRFHQVAQRYSLTQLSRQLERLATSHDLLQAHVAPRALVHDLYVGA